MISTSKHSEELLQNGYLNREIDPTLDLFAEINKLKKEKNAILLAHYYQSADIQDIADYIGDSLGLAQEAEKTTADLIVFAGVHFMAETAKILNPNKKVVLPDLFAGCSLADSCPPIEFAAFKAQHPNHVVICYINCTAEIKALSDYICTSSNAEYIVNSIPKETPIIFAPDKNLGAYLVKKTGRDMLLWDGACMVHEIFSLEKITRLKEKHPNALLISHPECEAPILDISDFVGSTTALLNFSKNNPANEFIVATETGILHKMQLNSPNKTFIPAPPNNSCACNDCPHMKLNTLEKIYLCMKYELPEILMSDELITKSSIPINRMLEISAKNGL
ncbi:MAG: quinolinate synthase NadA [Bacteroidetes bacterium]|nr:quinolinate synthase NadA [Bacteroidota bacterium]MBP7255456.1 quinolinate synthase NadA [Chitinophagales bacterium]MBK7137802.1 quinolinate synthase NadA [Bacteroidota bacterium]MBK7504682.1 quinolinate synthase NadA [Bacteroidota bacterium]MBK7641054.1 quinolinate synthase NadA [Bacteroidota bacterium]